MRILLEDLDSANGTSVRRRTEGQWTTLKGSSIPLNEGDNIRIGDGIAEFRVMGA
jgi:pSer/pThr/pTyr-binding forkhead associated (FHA) protein